MQSALRLASAALVVVGACILSYPAVSDACARAIQEQAMRASESAVLSLGSEELDRCREEARQYNDTLRHESSLESSGEAPAALSYNDLLDPSGNGVMAVIDIPRINVRLPVYHGTSEEVLDKGAGHLEHTALPIGEVGQRPVITGHRGLPQAELFTRLDELEMGDTFLIRVLDETLVYRVCSIETADPGDWKSIAPVEGRDLVTLVTCTPYGVNTHRLLVTGERTDGTAASSAKRQPLIAGTERTACALAALASLGILIATRRSDHHGRHRTPRP